MDAQLNARLKSCYAYDHETGVVSRVSGKVIGPVGKQNKDGYIYFDVSVGGRRHYLAAHRVAWFLQTGSWPAQYIDHKNRIRDDNRWCNLREATPRQNCQNRTLRRSGVTQWRGGHKARIRIDNHQYHIGTWPTQEMAERAFAAIKREFHEFAVEADESF